MVCSCLGSDSPPSHRRELHWYLQARVRLPFDISQRVLSGGKKRLRREVHLTVTDKEFVSHYEYCRYML